MPAGVSGFISYHFSRQRKISRLPQGKHITSSEARYITQFFESSDQAVKTADPSFSMKSPASGLMKKRRRFAGEKTKTEGTGYRATPLHR
jgi:hypothetical protein